jgi:serine/threonine protein kinase
MGVKGSDAYQRIMKMMELEFQIRTTLGWRCKYFVQYISQFNYGGYACISMEYCDGGDLQKELDKGRKFTKKVELN